MSRFDDYDYETFRRAAADDALDVYEKIGFPASYREGKEAEIFADIRRKLTNLERPSQSVLDIGPGCSPLPRLLVELARAQGHRLYLADSPEMLALLPAEPFVVALPGRFPNDQSAFQAQEGGRLDAVLAYSLLHYVFVEASLHEFLDAAVGLLAHGGQLLVGDVPNLSMRRRFFAAPAGREYHRSFTGSSDPPASDPASLERGKIDDAVLLGLVGRYRAAGYHAYLLPQAAELPMANRREDLLIIRP